MMEISSTNETDAHTTTIPLYKSESDNAEWTQCLISIKTELLCCPLPNCNDTKKSYNELNNHLSLHHRILPYRCLVDSCNMVSHSPNGISEHVSNVHNDGIPLKCLECETIFAEYQILSKHHFTTHQRGQFHCTYQGACQFIAETRAEVIQHAHQEHNALYATREHVMAVHESLISAADYDVVVFDSNQSEMLLLIGQETLITGHPIILGFYQPRRVDGAGFTTLVDSGQSILVDGNLYNQIHIEGQNIFTSDDQTVGLYFTVEADNQQLIQSMGQSNGKGIANIINVRKQTFKRNKKEISQNNVSDEEEYEEAGTVKKKKAGRKRKYCRKNNTNNIIKVEENVKPPKYVRRPKAESYSYGSYSKNDYVTNFQSSEEEYEENEGELDSQMDDPDVMKKQSEESLASTSLASIVSNGCNSIETEQIMYSCLVSSCLQMFSSNRALIAHFAEEHSEISDITCALCGIQFNNNNEMIHHLQTIHFEQPYIQIASPPPPCPRAKKRTSKGYGCSQPLCEYVSLTRYQLKRHHISTHSNLPHICRHLDCFAAFAEKEELIQHDLIIHRRVKPYKCKWSDCVYQCGRDYNLISHIRTQHFKIGPDCDINDDPLHRDPKLYMEVIEDLLVDNIPDIDTIVDEEEAEVEEEEEEEEEENHNLERDCQSNEQMVSLENQECYK